MGLNLFMSKSQESGPQKTICVKWGNKSEDALITSYSNYNRKMTLYQIMAMGVTFVSVTYSWFSIKQAKDKESANSKVCFVVF